MPQQEKKTTASESVSTGYRYRVSLYIIIPAIFSGISMLSFIIAFHAGDSSQLMMKHVIWGSVIIILTFLCGLLVVWLVLRPVKRFVKETEKLPVFKEIIKEKRQTPDDEIGYYGQILREVTDILGKVEAKELFPEIIGQSRLMRGVFKQILKVAPSDTTVLIMGESGTGKELVATGIFKHSNRRNKPFIKINCVAMPETLLESELFGYEKGAFTGATSRKKGKFELADGGTVFLDEVGDISAPVQAKLLRVLQEKEFDRLGGNRPIQVDVRLITATNKDLFRMVKEGAFREDLFYRLNVFPLVLPPLRERHDIVSLVESFLEEAPKPVTISQEAISRLKQYSWPGNVRELKNVIERAALMTESGVIEASHLPESIQREENAETGNYDATDGELSLDDRLNALEKRMIIDALVKANGRQVKAAQLLGIKDRSLWHRIRKHQIDVHSLKKQHIL